MKHYMCANCGNKCLSIDRPENDVCGGCKDPDWKLMKQQTAYKVGSLDYVEPKGEI